MSKQVIVDWFDDELSEQAGESDTVLQRQQIAASVKERLADSLDLRTFGTSDREVQDYVLAVEDRQIPAPDVLLIDLRLNTAENISPVTWRSGKALAAMLSNENALQNVPLYLVSGAFNAIKIPLKEQDFDRLLKGESLSRNVFQELVRDAHDYKRVSDVLARHQPLQGALPTEQLTDILALLTVPTSIANEVQAVIEYHVSRLVHGLSYFTADGTRGNQSLKLPLSRFIRQLFLLRNGPLASPEFLAVLLGVRFEYFQSNTRSLLLSCDEKLRYSGVFFGDWGERWWASAVIETLLDHNDGLTFASARAEFAERVAAALAVPMAERAKCAACDQLWPETLAQYEDDEEDWHPVHFRCCQLKLGTGLPGFEDLYGYGGDTDGP